VLGLTTDYTCLGHRLKLPCWLEVRQCHQQVTRTVCEGYLEPRLASLSGFTLILVHMKVSERLQSLKH